MTKIKYVFNPSSDTSFSFTADGVSYEVNIIWMDVEECWIIDVSSNGISITSGRVVVNTKNLFGNNHNNGVLMFKGDTPTRHNIGKTCFLYYYGNDDVNKAS